MVNNVPAAPAFLLINFFLSAQFGGMSFAFSVAEKQYCQIFLCFFSVWMEYVKNPVHSTFVKALSTGTPRTSWQAYQ